MPREESKLPGGVRVSDLVTLGVLAEHLPSESIQAALAKAGVSNKRERLLPMDLAALYVVALCLYRDVAYEEVLRCLMEGLRWLGKEPPEIATKGAVTQARAKLGVDAMRFLFEGIASPMATQDTKGAWYRNWRTVACDGTTLQVPDSKENAKAFGYAGGHEHVSFPLIRCACIFETGTHAAFAAAMRPYASSEIEMVQSLTGSLKEGMLLLADRGFASYDLWKQASATGADLLFRINSTWNLPKVKALPDGSWLSELPAPAPRRKKEAPVIVRVIQYRLEGKEEIFRLITTILEPQKAPAIELARLYHERWEAEGIFDEMKTHLKGSRLTLRSKTPDGVRQEFWGLMIAHRTLRALIHEAALKGKIDPDKISFTTALRIVRRTLPSRAALSP